ncbi:MAG TPA: hypothetical protein VEB64_15575 [Azospirillaceae bacterium]|nr:hypothetical protein [Azospirillaceae bacterium]
MLKLEMRSFVGLVPRVLAVMLLMAFPGVGAQAATINLSDSSTPSTALRVGDSGSLVHSSLGKGSFSQTFAFQLAQPAQINFNAQALFPSFSKFSVSLEGRSGNKWVSVASAGGGAAGANDVFTLNYAAQTPLSAYRLVVSGNQKSGTGMGYSGSYQVSPVPLPPAVILFATGLVGLWILRRKPQRVAGT